MKSITLLIAILCVSMLYAEDNNTYVKQQVAYKDQGASGKELTWEIHPLYSHRQSIGATGGDKDVVL